MNTGYQVGALSATFQSSSKRPPSASNLDSFFTIQDRSSRHLATKYVSPIKPVKIETGKRKRFEIAETIEDDVDVDGDEDEDEVNYQPRKKWKKQALGERKVAKKVDRDVGQEVRTVFVGNLSNTIEPKGIKKLFKHCGRIETVRMRSAALMDPSVPQKLGMILRDFHPSRKTLNAYVRFETVEEAEAALKLNGTLVGEFHMRVDKADAHRQHDNKRTVFLGNLSFDADEETILAHFRNCGEIEAVRIVRDAATRVGKGFGYVVFKTIHPVELALQLDGTDLDGRQVRVSRAISKPKKSFHGAVKAKMLKKGKSKLERKIARSELKMGTASNASLEMIGGGGGGRDRNGRFGPKAANKKHLGPGGNKRKNKKKYVNRRQKKR